MTIGNRAGFGPANQRGQISNMRYRFRSVLTRWGRFAAAAAVGAATAGDAPAARADLPRGVQVDQIVVKKGERRMDLFVEGALVASFPVQLGRNPVGPKIFWGDGRTPEGRYVISARNPDSRFYRSLRISYPNDDDIARAGNYGISAGGDIMIHGQPNRPRRDHDAESDWTEGCIAVTNAEMDELWSAVPVGTPVEIEP
jgi:murein L,D-transpeptidase YafK